MHIKKNDWMKIQKSMQLMKIIEKCCTYIIGLHTLYASDIQVAYDL